MSNAKSEQVVQRRRGVAERDQFKNTDKESLNKRLETQGQGDNQRQINKTPEKITTISSGMVEPNCTPLLNVKRPVLNKRSLSESSAEDLCRNVHCDAELSSNNINSNASIKMWRNKLQMKPHSTSAQPERRISVAIGACEKEELISDLVDIALRVAIVLIFIKLEVMSAFVREVHEEELWLYKNPRRPDIVTPLELLVTVIVAPFLFALAHYLYTKDKRDFRAANWAWTLTLCMNGLPTSILKITIGRLRPDFFYRCFPDGVMVLNNTTSSALDFSCTGKPSDINEGRKSFPSGHSSFAFASFGFIAFYIAGKLHSFNMRGRGQTWRLYLAISPLFLASLVAISRTCDYHHHWQDIVVGAVIGLFACYISYRQYYPSLFARNCHRPIVRWMQHASHAGYERIADVYDEDVIGYDGGQRPLLNKTCQRMRESK